MSDDEVEKFHRDKLLLDKNLQSDDDDSSDNELVPSKAEMELTHEEVQQYLDEEKQLRAERMMENEEDAESEPENDKIKANISVNDKRTRYGKNTRTSGMSAAQVEEMEQLALQEALEKKQEQERLVQDMDFEDPELQEADSDVDRNSDVEDDGKDRETGQDNSLGDSYPEVEKYLSIFKEIDEIELPKLEKIISEHLSVIKDAKTLVEFIDLKHSLLVDFKLAILFYLNLQLSNTKNLQFHPITPRLKKYEQIYNSYKIEGSDFQTLNELLDSVVEDQIEEEPIGEQSVEILDKLLIESRKPKKTPKIKNSEITETTPNSKENSEKKSGKLEDTDKRGISKEMEKSKGHILSKKKKIDRNPRVKNREKARVANWKHRKMHGVRKPKGRYDGEYSGINTTTTTSRKF